MLTRIEYALHSHCYFQWLQTIGSIPENRKNVIKHSSDFLIHDHHLMRDLRSCLENYTRNNTSQHETTRDNAMQHEYNTTQHEATCDNTNQHELNTTQHKTARVKHKTTQV